MFYEASEIIEKGNYIWGTNYVAVDYKYMEVAICNLFWVQTPTQPKSELIGKSTARHRTSVICLQKNEQD